MLYRFRSAGSADAVRADIGGRARALPAGAIAGTQSYLARQGAGDRQHRAVRTVPDRLRLIGIVMSVLIVANVVSGAVVSGYRRIGILKSIGFTPGQVAAAYTGQVAVPALAGCAAGVALGNLLAVPLLAKTATVYGVGGLRVPVWVDLAVPAAICGLAGLAALMPALAGRPTERRRRRSRRARAARRARLSGPPAARPAAAPALGLDRPRRPVRAAGAQAADTRGGRARRHGGLVRRRAHVLARRARRRDSTTRAEPVQVYSRDGPGRPRGVQADPSASAGTPVRGRRRSTVVAALRRAPGTLALRRRGGGRGRA